MVAILVMLVLVAHKTVLFNHACSTWCLSMCALGQVWRPETEVGSLPLSPLYTVKQGLSLSHCGWVLASQHLFWTYLALSTLSPEC